MNATISDRAKKILQALAVTSSLSRAEIEQKTNESRDVIIRELKVLVDEEFVTVSGEARATAYAISPKARTVVLWDEKRYLAEEPDKRNVRYRYFESELLKTVRGSLGKLSDEIESAAEVRRRMADSVTAKKDLERFVIELSWKSSKIEGNTYSLLDTERLIQEAKEAEGHSHDEAVMILNHKKAFDFIWEHKDEYTTLTKSQIEEVHRMLIDNLHVPTGLREHPVGITGTVYTPPGSLAEIAPNFEDIIREINSLVDPREKAMASLMFIPYLQPFADGNKRTSRLMANALLLAYGYPPLSYRSIDEQAYKGALILFYEQGTIANFRQLYLIQLEESAKLYYFPIHTV